MKIITITNNNIDHNNQILVAIINWDSQKVSHYGAMMKKHNLVHTTLWRTHTLQTVFLNKAITKFWQAFNAAQEKVLLSHLWRLVKRKTSFTFVIMRNIAEEIQRSVLDKYLVIWFINRHSHYLKSIYIQNIENFQKKQNMHLYFSNFTSWYEL